MRKQYFTEYLNKKDFTRLHGYSRFERKKFQSHNLHKISH